MCVCVSILRLFVLGRWDGGGSGKNMYLAQRETEVCMQAYLGGEVEGGGGGEGGGGSWMGSYNCADKTNRLRITQGRAAGCRQTVTIITTSRRASSCSPTHVYLSPHVQHAGPLTSG